MSVAVAGRSPTTFDIKSASLPLLTLRLKSPDLARLAKELLAQYGDRPDFFEDDAVVLDLSTLPARRWRRSRSRSAWMRRCRSESRWTDWSHA